MGRSLFMPVTSAKGFSVNYFSDEVGFLLCVMLVAIAAFTLTILLNGKWSRITAGVVASAHA